MNDKLAESEEKPTEESVLAVLSEENASVFKFLPDFIRAQLMMDRDPHGNVQVAKIETEKLLAASVTSELERRREEGSYSGSFKTQFHAYGYEGRAGMPTIFDASYCYALGSTAGALLVDGCRGLIAPAKNLLAPLEEWACGGVPVTSLCVIERRKGKEKPVIKKALVELEGDMSQPFQAYQAIRDELRLQDHYSVPGPIQYDVVNCPSARDVPVTLQLELGAEATPLPGNPVSRNMGGHLFSPQPGESRSDLQQWRSARQQELPESLEQKNLAAVQVTKDFPTMDDQQLIQFGKGDGTTEVAQNQKVGVVFCGRQAPGCHDLLCGLADMLESSEGSKLLGFVGGTKGLFSKQSVTLISIAHHFLNFLFG